MSSLSRGATGAIKPKSVNVNNIFAGRNIAPGQRASGRYGMQSVGKSSGAVRRMPPPAHLPSLKAENNGQDPTTPVVPQGGTGWSKGEGPAPPNEVQPPAQSPPQITNDLRPSWLVTPSEQVANSSAREFPSLAPTSDDEGKPINRWENSTLNQKLVELSAGDYCDRVPSRFLDATNTTPAPKPPPKTKYNKNSDDEGFDSQDRDRTYSTEESGLSPNSSPNQVEANVPQKTEEREVKNHRRHNEEQKSAYRANEIRILKRTEQLLLQDISDDEDEIQMTRLDKPNSGVIKRRGVPDSSSSAKPTKTETSTDTTASNGKEKSGKFEKPNSKEKKSNKKESKATEGEHHSEASDHKKHHKVSVPQLVSNNQESNVSPPPEQEEDVQPAPPPQENIWAKRQEERESQEREKDKSAIPRVMQQAIAHHFPLVTEAATIKVDKESTRKASDTEFTRAAIRARKQPTSNDVRKIHHGHDDVRNQNYRQNDNNDEREYYESSSGYDNNGPNRRGMRNAPNTRNDAGRHNNNRGPKNEQHQQMDEQLDVESQERGRRDSYRSNYSHESARNGQNGQRNGAPVTRGGMNRGRGQNGPKNMPSDRKRFEGEANKNNGQDNRQNAGKNNRKPKQADGEEKYDERKNVAGEIDDNDGFEEVQNKKTRVKKDGFSKPHNVPRAKQSKNGNRLFVPKALRKESDDLPANGLLSTQSADPKDKTKSNDESSKSSAYEEEAETDRGFNAIVNEISDLVGVEEKQTIQDEERQKDGASEEDGLLEFSDNCKITTTADTEYDFSFDPHLHSISQLTTEKATLQQMLSAVSGSSSDDATLKEKMNRIKDLWTVVSAEGERSNVAMVKPQPQVGDLVIMEGAMKGSDSFNVQSLRSTSAAPISLAPFSGHYSVFQPLYQNTDNNRLAAAATAASPPNNYLSMSPYSGVSTQPNYSFENGASNRTSANVNQQHNIWNNGHLDIAALAGTPPPAVIPNSNGNYAFFGSGQQKNTQNGFSGVGNSTTSSLGLGNSQQPQQQFYDRPSLPPANLAVGSQRQSNIFNTNSTNQNSNNRMNGMGNIPTSNGSFVANFFNQPPPPVNQPPHNIRYPNNGPNNQSHNNEQNSSGYFFNGSARTDNRGMNNQLPGQSDMNWPNSNYFNNPPPPNHQPNGGWNNGQNSNGPRQFQPNQFRDQQQQINRVRRPFAGPTQGSRQ